MFSAVESKNRKNSCDGFYIMRKKIIIGFCLIVIGLGILVVFSRETPGIIAATVFVAAGLVLALSNRKGEI